MTFLAASGGLANAHVAPLKLSPAVGPPTSGFTVSGRGFEPGEQVDVLFDGTILASALADADGRFVQPVEVPADAVPGHHDVRATGLNSGNIARGLFLVRTDWTQFRFDLANTGHNPYENVIGPDTVGSLRLSWTRRTGGPINYSGPVVSEGFVYITSDDHTIWAFDATTGKYQWNTFVDTDSAGGPAISRGLLYVGATDGTVRAVDTDGVPVWTSVPSGAPIDASPTPAGDMVYAGSEDGVMYAFDAATGETVWTYATRSKIGATVAVAGGSVYFPGHDRKLYALDAATGDLIWRANIEQRSRSSPSVVDGVVYLGSEASKVFAFDARTGEPIWSVPVGGRIYRSSPAVVNGILYIGADDARLYALDTETGGTVWQTPVLGGDVESSPAVANGVVYVAAGLFVYGFHAATGEELWRELYNGGVFVGAPPTVANGRVYVGSVDQRIYCFAIPE